MTTQVHYFIVIAVVALIVFCQIFVYFIGRKSTSSLARRLGTLFPKDFRNLKVHNSVILTTEEIQSGIEDLMTEREGANEEETAVIDECIAELKASAATQRDYNQTFKSLLSDINNYLKKNKSGVCDYNIIKDMVDRSTETKEEEISTQVPIPLYLGLMGTMFGIIVGIGYFILSHGLSGLLSDQETVANSASGIESLLTCVALAMVASFIGVYLTTRGSVKLKNGKNKVEDGKNSFLSWIQAELLPNIGTDVSGSLVKMSENLKDFNSTFSKNTKQLNDTLGGVKTTTLAQQRLLETIRDLNVNRMAEANVKVYKALQNSTDDIERMSASLKDCTASMAPFAEYMQNSSEYLRRVNELNQTLNEVESRTQAIEEMGNFFKTEMTQIQQREAAMRNVVGNADMAMRDALEELQQGVAQRMNAFQNNLGDIDRTFTDATNDINARLRERLETTEKMLDELQQLKSLRESIVVLTEKTDAQNDKFDSLIASIKQLAAAKPTQVAQPMIVHSPVADVEEKRLPSLWESIPVWVKAVSLSIGGVVTTSCLFVVVVFILLMLQ